MTDAEQISLLEQEKENIRLFSERYFEITKQLAQLYYRQKEYRLALNRLQILENSANPPEWVNLYIAASLIQSADLNYFRLPERHFFNRLNNVDVTNESAVNQRNAIFKDALRIFIEKRDEKNLEIDFDAYLNQAEKFNLIDSDEWRTFKAFYFDEEEPEEDFDEVLESEEEEALSQPETIETSEIDTPPVLPFETAETEQAGIIAPPKEPEIFESPKKTEQISLFRSLLKGGKILVIGKMNGKVLPEWKKEAKKEFGLQERDFDFYSDYYKCTKKLQSIKTNSGYAAIIVGAISHSDDGIIKKWKDRPEYPKPFYARSGKELKLTKNSFFNALRDVKNHFAALPCD